MRTDARKAWKATRTDALAKREGIAAHDPGIRKDSLAPRSESKPANSREVVYGQQATDEVAKYAARLNAQDWSIEAMPFDLDFETSYVAFWSWRGAIQDRRAALRMVLHRPGEDICTIFTAWRDVCGKIDRSGGEAIGMAFRSRVIGSLNRRYSLRSQT